MKYRHIAKRLLAGAFSAALLFTTLPAGLVSAEELGGVDEGYLEISGDAFLADAEDEFAAEDMISDAEFDASNLADEALLEEEFFEEEAGEAAAGEADVNAEAAADDLFAADGLIEDPDAVSEAAPDETGEEAVEGEEAFETTNFLAEILPVSFFAGAADLVPNTEYTISIAELGNYGLFKLVPSETAMYKFYNYPLTEDDDDDNDTIIVLYDDAGKAIDYDDDDGVSSHALLNVKLDAGKTYYVRTAAYGSYSGFQFKFKAEKLSSWILTDLYYEYELPLDNNGVTLESSAESNLPLSYQWYKDNVSDEYKIAGATGPSYNTGKLTGTTYYYLVVSNGTEQKTVEYEVQIIDPFTARVADGCEDENYVKVGDTVQLGVTASGSSGYSYSWYDEEDDPITEYDEETLTVNGAADTDRISLTFNTGGYYCFYCRVTDNRGEIRTVSFEVEVESFYLQYEDEYYGLVGDNYTMEVTVVDAPENAEINYQWFDEDGEPMNCDPGAPNKCTLTNIQDSSEYICRVTVNGESRNAYFEISVSSLKVYPDGPSEFHININETATMKVKVEALDTSQLTYQWSVYDGNDDEYVQISGANSEEYTTPAEASPVYREYRCRVSDQNENYAYTHFYVHFGNTESFYLDYTGNVIVKLHGSAAMKVTPAGNYKGTVTYQWYFRPGGTVSSYIKLDGQTGDTLTINDVLETNQRYICRAKDGDGNTAFAEFSFNSADDEQHKWTAGAITKQPTCTEPGMQNYTCTDCGAQKTEAVPALGHAWGASSKIAEATIHAPETHVHTCTRCGASENIFVGAKLTPFIKLNVSGTVPMKTKQVCKLIKATYANGDSVASVNSSNKKVVKVSQKNGTLTLRAQKVTGVSKITVKLASGLSKSFKVKVQKAKVITKKVKVVKKSATLKPKGTFDVDAQIFPITTQSGKTKYTTSNKKAVSVSNKGIVKAKKKGNAVITVKSGSKTAKVKITVQ